MSDDTDIIETLEGKTQDLKEKKPCLAQQLVTLAAEQAELWKAEDGTAYATVMVQGHRENRRILSASFRQWLVGTFYDATEVVANDKAIRSAIEIIAHHASRRTIHRVHLRWARDGDRIYCDLGREQWDAVEIDRDGWRIVQNPPVKFRRTGNMAAMPVPVKGAMLDDLRKLCNATEEGWVSMKGFVLDAIKGCRPYYILCIHGEQGSAKSMTCRLIRRLLDPVTKGELSAKPRDENDLVIVAQNDAVMAFDNVSFLNPEMADALCRCSTGGGIKTRQLYTDADVVVLDIAKPVIINGIPDVATAPDLLSRCLVIHQPTIAPDDRKTEAEINDRFAAMLPGLLADLFDHAARGLRDANAVKLASQPRMADSCKWITAATGSDEFFQHATQAEAETIAELLESDPTATILKKMVDGEWLGTPAQLWERFRHTAAVEGINGRIPEGTRGLSHALRRLAPALRTTWGWTVEQSKTNGVRLIRLKSRDAKP